MENVKSFLTRIREPDKSVPRHKEFGITLDEAKAAGVEVLFLK